MDDDLRSNWYMCVINQTLRADSITLPSPHPLYAIPESGQFEELLLPPTLNPAYHCRYTMSPSIVTLVETKIKQS